jgi:hypothetical protein
LRVDCGGPCFFEVRKAFGAFVERGTCCHDWQVRREKRRQEFSFFLNYRGVGEASDTRAQQC